ncbi:SGNH/GDSL hydrolase family protein [Streptacidiphilus sp. P02-A3a]|uniref:SGNH/GDSL hydrolase family protein n=1 Tax=Streptacidiphilus sp. P02-A3a TaxID=2704468 RepID=UPI001CDD68AF|nr:SGNH/GDSL hydrolase family protein [Streptacidiphilus sp. P02-A3a]
MLAVVAALGVALGLAAPAQAVTGAAASPASAKAGAVAAVASTPLRLEPMGDSITYGYQSTTGNGYRGPLWDELTAEGHPLDFVGSVQGGTMSDPDNEGHSGWRIDQLAAITDSSLATYKPNVITLMIGTNDLGQDYEDSTAPDRLSALVDQIVRDDPTATVLVANLIVSTNTEVAAAEPAYNATIPSMVAAKQAAGDHVAFVDMSALTTADLFDALHPNDGGYQKMADAWNKGIQAADAAGWITPPVANGAPTPRTSSAFASGIAGQCLDDFAGSSADGTVVDLYGCNRTAAQTWTPYTDGTLRINGKCLDITGASTTDGALVELWDCNGGGNQVWQQGANNTLVNPTSGKCLDDPGFSTTNGTQLDIWDCNGGSNQQWTAA